MKSEKKVKKGALWGLGLVLVVLCALVSFTFEPIKNSLNLGLDLKGGFEILYQVDPLEEGGTVDMTAVVNSVSKRVNVLGVSEPTIVVEGNDRIRIQLAGVSDQASARQLLGATANLTFRDVEDNELADSSILTEGGASLAYQDGLPVVSLKIKDSEKFYDITKEIAAKTSGENVMVIWLDWEDGDTYREEAAKAAAGQEAKYISAASVRTGINGDCIISGNFTDTEAKTLANLINSGSLPVKLSELSSNVVSAQFGEEALSATAMAGVVGIILVMLTMIFVYGLPGILSSIMLVLYIWAVFGVYALMGATFTLFGIGALVLGVGMTVDANIINFERIRQELYKGHNVRNAIAKGQQLSFSAIFDSQFTTLISALIMYIWGNGAVKGFATMLIITVIMTLLINVGFSKWLLDTVANSGVADGKPQWFRVKKSDIPDVSKGEKQFAGIHKFDFVDKSKYTVRVALIAFVVAIVFSVTNAVKGNGAMNLGIDFSSGTKLTVTSAEKITINDVQSKLEGMGFDGFSYQSAGESIVYATTKEEITTEQLTQIKDSLTKTFGEEPGDNVVTPVVGRELVRNAFVLTIVAWIAMMLYITFRYQWQYAIGCIVALIHDVLMVLAVFAIFRMEINTEVISVLLTIIGYSINNSIIVFDRVREHMAMAKANMNKEELAVVLNQALNETFSMSLWGAITTIIPVIVILAIGANTLFTFMFAMLIGLISGTFSSMFIAPTVFRVLYQKFGNPKKKNKKKEYKEELDEYSFKGINA